MNEKLTRTDAPAVAGTRTEPLSKDELLPPGTYTAIRLEHLASTDLRPADKLILALLANELRATTRYAHKSARQIAAGTGLGHRTVKRRLAALQVAGHLVRTDAPDGRSLWGLLPTGLLGFGTPPGASEAPPQGQRGTTPGPTGPHPGASVAPARGHGGTPSLHTRNEQSTGAPTRARARASDLEPRNLAETAAVQHTRQVLAEATGGQLHTGWVGAILDDCRVGAADIWTELTVADVVAARQLASAGKGYRFGPWAIRAHQGDVAATEAARARREQTSRREDQQEAADQEAAAKFLRDRKEIFARLGPADQTRLLAVADTKVKYQRKGKERTAVVQATAEFLAWQEIQEEKTT